MEEDRMILEGICHREQDAFRKLFDKYGAYVVAVTAKVAGNILSVQDMEEISSDVFAKLWKKGPELRLSKGSRGQLSYSQHRPYNGTEGQPHRRGLSLEGERWNRRKEPEA